ncbi:MAG: hypothetical protein VX836_18390 [Pseudomonadota bacterium]|nr:hypothetical protein [Pseudomonadota bacterium]
MNRPIKDGPPAAWMTGMNAQETLDISAKILRFVGCAAIDIDTFNSEQEGDAVFHILNQVASCLEWERGRTWPRNAIEEQTDAG